MKMTKVLDELHDKGGEDGDQKHSPDNQRYAVSFHEEVPFGGLIRLVVSGPFDDLHFILLHQRGRD